MATIVCFVIVQKLSLILPFWEEMGWVLAEIKELVAMYLIIQNKMYSKLNDKEFFDLLKLNTAVGNVNLKLSPIGISHYENFDKVYYGKFDGNSFKLCFNHSSVLDMKGFVINGTYTISDNQLVVRYTIDRGSKFLNIWHKYNIIIFLILLNGMLMEADAPLPIYFLATPMLIMCFLIGVWLENRKKRRLDREFIKNLQLY